MERPDPELERLLMISPEAREERRMQRVGELPVEVGRLDMSRGRQRQDQLSSDGLPLSYSDTVPIELIEAVGRELQGYKLPLFDRFTKARRVTPDKEAIFRYCSSPNTKADSVMKARNAKALGALIMPADLDPRTPEEVRSDRLRQTQHIADVLEADTFSNWLTARLWRQSLKTAQLLMRAGSPLDKYAARISADAIRDMGYALLPQKISGITQPSNVQLGTHMSYLGTEAVNNTDLLIVNSDLLRLTQAEQAKREGYWGRRYEFMSQENVLGDRLTSTLRGNQAAVEVEIVRQMAYNQAA